MAEFLDSIVATVESLEETADGDVMVKVRVKAAADEMELPIVGKLTARTPNAIANIRARARALIAAGAVPSSVETVRDVAMGDVERLTDVVSEQEMGTGRIVDKVYTIKVNS